MRTPRFPRLATLFRAAACAAALCACASTDEGVTDEQRIALHREFARKYFDAGDLLQAERQVDMGLEIDDEDDGLRLMKAWLLLKRNTGPEVLAAQERFRELAEDGDYRALLGLAESLERTGVLYFESADKIESGATATPAADPKKRAAELRRDARAAWKESREVYLAVLGTRPSEIQAINGLQRVCALEGDLSGSAEWSRKLLDLAEKEIAFWREELKRPNLTAVEENDLRKRVGASAKLLVETHLTASTTLLALSRPDEAVAHLGGAIELAPERAEIYSRRAQLLKQLGRPREARDDLRQFVKLSTLPLDAPDMRRAYDLLSECEAEIAKLPAVGG